MEITLKVPWSPKMVMADFRADLPEGVTIHVPPVRRYRDVFLNSVPWVEVTVTITTVAGSLASVATFLWTKFGEGKKPVEKVVVNRRREVKWTKDEFTSVIEEEWTKERNSKD
jgi:hypothetical protein